LVTTKGGREIAKQLVTSLMQQQIGQQVSVGICFTGSPLRLTIETDYNAHFKD
jgi:hypothetical protein